MKRIFLAIILTISLFTTTSYSQLTTDKNLYKKNNSNTRAIGFGASNFIMHGDLRSTGTGNLGNFGTYVYVDKMFNPLLGLELKINYSKISGGAQYFSEVYKILYVNQTKINNNLFFEGTAYGAELNLILSFSNLYATNAKKWHAAGYFG